MQIPEKNHWNNMYFKWIQIVLALAVQYSLYSINVTVVRASCKKTAFRPNIVIPLLFKSLRGVISPFLRPPIDFYAWWIRSSIHILELRRVTESLQGNKLNTNGKWSGFASMGSPFFLFGFGILPKDTSACRWGLDSSRWPSGYRTTAQAP